LVILPLVMFIICCIILIENYFFLLNSVNYGDWVINEIMTSIGEFTQKMGYDWSHINQYQQINMYKIHLLMQKKSTFESWVYYASNGFRKNPLKQDSSM